MALRFHGDSNKGPTEVDPNTLALYGVNRPGDFRGSYSYSTAVAACSTSGGSGWGPGSISNGSILGFQWTAPNVIGVLRKVIVSMGQVTNGTAGVTAIALYPARGYTQQYDTYIYSNNASTSTVISQIYVNCATNVFLGNGNKLRTTFPPSVMSGNFTGSLPNYNFNNIESSSLAVAFSLTPTPGATILPGTNIVTVKNNYNSNSLSSATNITGLMGGVATIDSQPLASVSSACPSTSGAPAIPVTLLYDGTSVQYPYVMDMFTGFTINITVPGASGIFTTSITLQWDEYYSYF